MDPIVYLNGKFIPLGEATISPMDRGFQFADGIYEVVAAFGRRLFKLDEHIRRLQNSLNLIRLSVDLTEAQWRSIFEGIVTHNEGQDLSVFLQVTRGIGPLKRSHAFPEHNQPTIFGYSYPITINERDALEKGATAITLPDARGQICHVKSIALLPNVLASQGAKEVGARETILIRDGFAIEGASSNLFIVKNNQLITPPLSPFILGGITRDFILSLAKQWQVPFCEQAIKVDELHQADEVWITSTTRDIIPIVEIDGKPIANGQAGPLWQKMIDYYLDYRTQLSHTS